MAEQIRKQRPYILMFLLTLAVLIGTVYLLRRPEPRVVTIITPAPQVSPPGTPIQVWVSGAIAQPGVYTLTLGSRVAEAIEAAGGARPDADLNELDLAFKLADGDSVRVPVLRSASQPPQNLTPTDTEMSGTTTVPGVINVNTASIESLDTLPHIGPILAKRIVDYRAARGPFERIEDLKLVTGIGDAIFDDIKDLIVVK